MRLVVQRVSSSHVKVDGEVVASIGPGLLVLAGVAQGDGLEAARRLAGKVARLRVFPDASGKMNLSAGQAGGKVLAVPQFTLYGDTARGNRPSFAAAAPPDEAREVIGAFVAELRSQGLSVEEGRFGAHMEVALVNDGPVTLIVES